MTWDWQQIAALACVAVAVVVLLKRVRRLWKSPAGGGCGAGCNSCATNDAHLGKAAIKPIVTLDVRRPGGPRPGGPRHGE